MAGGRREEGGGKDLPTYLRDLGDDPSSGNLHLSTYLFDRNVSSQRVPTPDMGSQRCSSYLAVGSSQFLALPSFTEYMLPFLGICRGDFKMITLKEMLIY